MKTIPFDVHKAVKRFLEEWERDHPEIYLNAKAWEQAEAQGRALVIMMKSWNKQEAIAA